MIDGHLWVEAGVVRTARILAVNRSARDRRCCGPICAFKGKGQLATVAKNAAKMSYV